MCWSVYTSLSLWQGSFPTKNGGLRESIAPMRHYCVSSMPLFLQYFSYAIIDYNYFTDFVTWRGYGHFITSAFRTDFWSALLLVHTYAYTLTLWWLLRCCSQNSNIMMSWARKSKERSNNFIFIFKYVFRLST